MRPLGFLAMSVFLILSSSRATAQFVDFGAGRGNPECAGMDTPMTFGGPGGGSGYGSGDFYNPFGNPNGGGSAYGGSPYGGGSAYGGRPNGGGLLAGGNPAAGGNFSTPGMSSIAELHGGNPAGGANASGSQVGSGWFGGPNGTGTGAPPAPPMPTQPESVVAGAGNALSARNANIPQGRDGSALNFDMSGEGDVDTVNIRY